MVKGCREYYMIDAIVDGNIIRKRKYCKISTMLTSMWYDYNNVKVEDPSEISRIEGLAIPDNKVDASYDDYSVFVNGTNQVDSLSNIPMDKHFVVVRWDPNLGENTINMKYNKTIDGDSFCIVVINTSSVKGDLNIPVNKDDVENIVNIGSSSLKVASGVAEVIKVTYRDNKWYWENRLEIPENTMVDDTIDSDMDLSSLNLRYPDATIGFCLICPLISKKYKYIGSGKWIVISFSLLS